jgi:hypothetical protein
MIRSFSTRSCGAKRSDVVLILVMQHLALTTGACKASKSGKPPGVDLHTRCESGNHCSRRIPRMLRGRPSTEVAIAHSSVRIREPNPPSSDPRGAAGTERHPPSHSSVFDFETSHHFLGAASWESLAYPSHVHAPPTKDFECRTPQTSELLFLGPNSGTGHNATGRTSTTTAHLRRPGTRSEAEHFAAWRPGVGFPSRSGCPRRPEIFAGVWQHPSV